MYLKKERLRLYFKNDYPDFQKNQIELKMKYNVAD